MFQTRRPANALAVICIVFGLLPIAVLAQSRLVKGQVTDQSSGVPLAATTIQVFDQGRISGSVSNNEGNFQVWVSAQADSMKFSSIGYHSKVITLSRDRGEYLSISLAEFAGELPEVIIRPAPALEIVKRSIEATQGLLPPDDYEKHFFYREIIRDSQDFFSVGEAVFTGQFAPARGNYRLKLQKGRTKEDVAYTRLFEDFHPGGGPEGIFALNLTNGLPDFFSLKKLKLFNYHKDSVVRLDDRNIYVIGFDQKPDVHEALDKGKIYIDADDYSLVKYETENSPRGTPYIKDLTGTDKLFAELLHIDFRRKGWQKTAQFTKENGKLYLAHGSADYQIGYKQPKKGIDLDLDIATELAATDEAGPVTSRIPSGEEWRSKNIVANLPTDFDPGFWGQNNIISPTKQLDSIIATISLKNHDAVADTPAGNWKYFQQDLFRAYQGGDSIRLVPVMKRGWYDDETAGMLYQEVSDDFFIESEVLVSQRSNRAASPENGFQQAGLIVRDPRGGDENSLVLCLGTGGNGNKKYFLRNTVKGKSKGPVDKTDSLHAWLRIEKHENLLSAFIRQNATLPWKKITDYKVKWAEGPLQAGLMIMATFAGSGPRMKPDVEGVFNHVNIQTIKR